MDPVDAQRMSIAEMPLGTFWCRAESIGSTVDETKASLRGELTPERQAELRMLVQMASQSLIVCEAAGRC